MDTTVNQEHATERQTDGNDGIRLRIEELKERIGSLNERAKGFIKEHPAACLMGAVGLGYLFARMARRRS
ncbi:MAG TPA: hypothetical protein VF550_19375 [Polyangia bacterium]